MQRRTTRGTSQRHVRRQHFAAMIAGLAIACGAQPSMQMPDRPAAPTDATSDGTTDVDLGDSTTAGDTSPPTDVRTPVDAGYPEGPYGNQVGDVMPDFTFQGYWAPTRTTGLSSEDSFETITFDRIRRSGARYVLMELGAYW